MILQIPVRRIFSTIEVWAVWVAVVGAFFVAQFVITFLPMYLTQVLGYSPATAGFVAIAPVGLLVRTGLRGRFPQLVIKFVTGLLSDYIQCISELWKLRFFNSLAMLGSGVFFLVVCMRPPLGNALDVVLIGRPIKKKQILIQYFQWHSWVFKLAASPKVRFSLLVSTPASSCPSSKSGGPKLSSQMILCLTMFGGSFLVPALTTREDFDGWRRVFLLYAIGLVVCNTFFVLFAGAEPASWTKASESATNGQTAATTLTDKV